MEEGREPRTGSGRPPHEALVKRIVSGAAGAAREERARAIVEAIAGLLERHGGHAQRVLAELLENDGAKERLAIAIACPIAQVPTLLGGATVALYPKPGSAKRRDQVSNTLTLCLLGED